MDFRVTLGMMVEGTLAHSRSMTGQSLLHPFALSFIGSCTDLNVILQPV